MGNTDPNKTKAGNKYEVKPQYEELSKQINMQHAINQCYECMRLSKEISQLDRCNNRQILSCRLYTTVYQPGNHRSVIIGARQPITARWETLVSGSHRSDDRVGLFRHDPLVGQSQRGTQSGYQIKSVNQAQDVCMNAIQYPCSMPNMPKRKTVYTFNQNSNWFASIQLHNHANPTARSILRSYASMQALTTKNRAQTTRNAHPKAHASRRTRERTFLKSFELQQLHVSTPALKQRLKWVADERAKQGESSATKVVKNRGWIRWNSAVENHGEQ
ncbi:pentatricopeptide repeat-containing protein mitochondrial [Dorcoceras hygrometricum]|uniref:Pentatricopeptide repeat-containing protein mitochondrial n=1 Tax=Dorcoceras hygrometricum TaxID=472368 RepID=A0A2Z7BHX7_9LAMI|nr:pentatricopeptide repeat-containing protein mitochondrial [Dorcoceras hygrometricum]